MDKNQEHEIIKLIITLYSLSQTARLRGLLELEDWLDCIDNGTIKQGLAMVIEGADPDQVADYFKKSMDAEGDQTAKLMIELGSVGVPRIQCGESSEAIKWQSLNLLDNDMKRQVMSNFISFENMKDDFYRNFSTVHTGDEIRQKMERTLKYEMIMSPGHIISGIGHLTLGKALMGCSLAAAVRTMERLPLLEMKAIMEQCRDHRPDPEDVAVAQAAVTEWAESMNELHKDILPEM